MAWVANMTGLLLPLYGLTLLLSALLLFWVQLMVAKMLLPLLGGAPAVWNTCLFFFQALLLVGYGYSDWLTRRWQFRDQLLLQALLLGLPIFVLPIRVAADRLPPVDANPIPWLLGALLVGVGLPFLALATLAPLLQAWFSRTSHPQAQDPYFLYGASNFGSLLGLLGYPLILEPRLTLTQQNTLWTGLYGVLVILILGCGIGAWGNLNVKPRQTAPLEFLESATINPTPVLKLTRQEQLRWVILAFIPSSWLLSVTTYITTDIAAIPLFWAIPLSLYLLTFMVAFARPDWRLPHWLTGTLPLLAVLLVMLLLLKVTQPLGLILPLHLLGFVMAAYIFHQHLAQARPPVQDLTRFYLAIALGGMLGGLVNSLIAPLVFRTVLEYPLMLVISLLLLKTLDLGPGVRLTWPLSIGLLFGCLLIGWNGSLGWQQGLGLLVALGLFGVIAWAWALKRWQWGLGLGLVILLGCFSWTSFGGVLTTQRSFFGVYQVLHDPKTGFHSLIHGTTVHGQQNLTQAQAPLTYFTPTGPIGQVMTHLGDQFNQVAVLGLGVGTLMSYAQPGQAWSFYEIDPLVVELAANPNYFTYLAQAPVTPQIILGDGRLQLAQAPDQHFDLLVMDAFSSDAIPTHLLTQEALNLYFQKLKPTGLVAINITNRFLDLEPVLAALSNSLGLIAIQQYDQQVSPEQLQAGKTPSRWVLFTKNRQNFRGLDQDVRWQPLRQQDEIQAWTDDFSQLLPLIRPLR